MKTLSTTRGFPVVLQNFMVLTFVLIVIEQIWSFATLYSNARNGLFESIIHTLPVACCALLVRFIANQYQGKHRLGWHILSWSLISWVCGQIIYFSLLFGFKLEAFPSFADVFYTAAPFWMVIGFFVLPHQSLPKLEGLRAVLDAVIIVITVFVYFWYFILSPAILYHILTNHIGLGVGLAISYPVYDLIAAALLLTSIARWQSVSLKTNIRWLFLQLIFWLIADGYFLARCFVTSLSEAHPLEIGWTWGAFCIVLAAKDGLNPSLEPEKIKKTKNYLIYYRTYLAILLIIPLLIMAYNVPFLQQIGVGIGFALILFTVLARQIVLTLDLERSNNQLQKLTNELESRVAARTADLEFRTLHDALTGLPNRVFLERHLNRMLELHGTSNLSVAVLYIDLDHFKDINDTLGHPIGDEVLRQVTERFQACIPENGFLARLGGDEFSLVLSKLEPATAVIEAQYAAEHFIQALASALRVGDAEFFLGASIGISLAPNDGVDATSLQKHADSAMYRAKREGIGWRVYSPDLDTNTTLRLETERALRRALETDPGSSFQVHYQPILEIQTGQIVALEALVRWTENNVMRSPAQFIPIAEECGLIVPLGTWILHEACKQMVLWEEYDLRVSVNVSTAQFERPDFVRVVSQALEQSQLKPERLSLELLEGVLVSRFEETASKISQLRATGIQLALDDFGSGYSSLSYLNRLTFDTLKLDRSFIHALGSARDTRALVAAIVSIAGEFGMDTIAEGVETNAQLETLKTLGCNKVQGWLYAPAMSAIELEAFLKRGTLEAQTFTL